MGFDPSTLRRQTQPAWSGNLVQNIGYATAAKVIYFDPERTVITLP